MPLPVNYFDACPCMPSTMWLLHRWDAAAKELVCDTLGVAYPVVNGMPNLRPADGRVIEVGDKDADPLAQPWGDDADAAGTGQSQPLQAGIAKPSGT